MANIIPFKGTLYNKEKITDFSKVIAPPYDVISKEEQDSLYNNSPYNIIHILFGKIEDTDDDKNNRYIRAYNALKDFEKESVLKKDEEEAFYVYMQEFMVEGSLKKRIGFLGLLKLEEFHTPTSSVYPHENTLSKPKEDRLKLIEQVEANIGPIFALFSDETKTVDNILLEEVDKEPLIDIIDHLGIKNKLWRIKDKGKIQKIVTLIKDKKLFIADGHHRYEVGLEFSKMKKDPKFGYILTYFTDAYGEGLVVLPVHRLIKGVDKNILDKVMGKLTNDFKIENISKEHIKKFLDDCERFEKRFVLYDGSSFSALLYPKGDSLDVTILHDLVIASLKEENNDLSINFTKDLNYAVSEVDNDNYSLAILLNPTKVDEIQDTAFSGKRMPQKSTYFYPKVLSGLVINVF